MTVANETARTSATGSAAAGQEIAFSFPINATSDLIVKTRVTATGVEATLDETDDYTVEISGDIGGTVTLVDALANTSTVHVYRDTPNTQSLDLETGGTFNGENIEDALDKLTRIVNDHTDKLSRAIIIPVTDSPDLDMTVGSSKARASTYFMWSAAGEPSSATSVATGEATITDAAKTVLDDDTIAAMRTTLGVKIGTNVQAWDTQLDDIAALVPTNSYIIVGDGTNWVRETTDTARTSLGAAADAEVCKIDGSVAYTAYGVGFRDEDDMFTNDATAPPSQQSVRAFLYSIVTYHGDVLTHNGEVLTYV